jgi:hypothetical protein
MFSLLVSNVEADKSTTTVKHERSRFLENTDPGAAAQLASLSDEAIDCLKA